MKTEVQAVFSKAIANKIAMKSFGYVLDSILGYGDPDYDLRTDVAEFEQNFEEDLEEMGLKSTERRIKICCDSYEKIKEKFEAMVRKRYY